MAKKKRKSKPRVLRHGFSQKFNGVRYYERHWDASKTWSKKHAAKIRREEKLNVRVVPRNSRYDGRKGYAILVGTKRKKRR